jgi:solute carrier family 35, member F1/2
MMAGKPVPRDEHSTLELPPATLDDDLEDEHHDTDLQETRHCVSTTHCQSILWGQGIALVACSMNASAFTLAYHLHVQTHFFQMLGTYGILIGQWHHRAALVPHEEGYRVHGTSIQLHMPAYKYACMSLLDIVPNILVLTSFNTTSLTSTTLLGSLCVPSVMCCSRILLARTFGRRHYLGVALCLVGGSIMVWSDATRQSPPSDDNATTSSALWTEEQQPHSYLGDALAIAAALLYGLGDTVAEYSVKRVDRAEFLSMMGVGGLCFSIAACILVERNAIHDLWHLFLDQPWTIVGALAWFAISNAGYYLAASWFLIHADATLLNLSVQTSNVWALWWSSVVYHMYPSHWFYLAVTLVVSGVILYEWGGMSATAESRATYEMTHDSEEDEVENETTDTYFNDNDAIEDTARRTQQLPTSRTRPAFYEELPDVD